VQLDRLRLRTAPEGWILAYKCLLESERYAVVSRDDKINTMGEYSRTLGL